MVQHCKSSDASNSDMPKRNCKVLPLREKVKLLDLTGKKNYMWRELRSTVRMNLLSMKVGKRKEKFVLILLLYPKMQKLWPQYVIVLRKNGKGLKCVQ